MSEHSLDAVDKHVGIYKKVFGTLVILTIATVACSYIHFPVWIGLIVGLAIATVKGGLVAAFFMHLAWERKLIFVVLLTTLFCVVAMVALILGHYADLPRYQ